MKNIAITGSFASGKSFVLSCAKELGYKVFSCDDFIRDAYKDKRFDPTTDKKTGFHTKSIICMPKHMWLLCLCNLFCWMSLVTYSLYFTDYVGQTVYKGGSHVFAAYLM